MHHIYSKSRSSRFSGLARVEEQITFTVGWSPIYILADGSVTPSTARILQNGNEYTLTGNITSSSDGIIIQKSNVTIDGAGYTLSGSGIYSGGLGFNLAGVNHVTIKNMTITNFAFGIRLNSASNNIFSGNNITSNNKGIHLVSSSGNTFSGNKVTSMNLWYSAYDRPTLIDYGIGIMLASSSNGNNIYHNNFVINPVPVSTGGSVNVWDDGYPSGGNYWSGYLTKYPNAAENDSSGIWNTPYVIDTNNTDHYPLIGPYPLMGQFHAFARAKLYPNQPTDDDA